MSVYVQHNDFEIRNLPSVGELTDNDFKNILQCILNKIVKIPEYFLGDEELDIAYLTEFMSKQKKAVIK